MGQDHERVATEEARSKVLLDSKQSSPGNTEEFLNEIRADLVGPRSVEIIQYFVSGILECCKCGFLGKVVQVGVISPALEQTIFANDGLNGEIEGEVKDLVMGNAAHRPQE